MPSVYFLCSGNACRSQMAEGFARQMLGSSWQVASAGVTPTKLDPRATAVMAEAGVDISQQYAKPINMQTLETADLVITLCGDARDKCPTTPPQVRHLHWPLPDPARATGSEAEVMATFRQVRDEIKQRVLKLAAKQDE